MSVIQTTPIWQGSSSFFPGDTPFGFYDYDNAFQQDADKVAKFCAIRLGFPLVDVELQSGSFYACFEEAITVYGNIVYQWQIQNNYLTFEGNPTASNYNHALVTPNLGGIIRISDTYGAEAGVGGNVTWYTGSIDLQPYVQTYDLNAWASSSANLQPGDSIEIKRIFYEAPPAIIRYFDPYAGTGTGIQSLMDTFGFGNFSPGINFMLMPIYFDIQKIQAIEFNDQVRKSSFSFELINNKLRIFPIPNMEGSLWFQYIKKSERNSPISVDGNGNPIGNVITNPSNVPYTNPVYCQLNTIGRQWVYEYTLALSKELLGYVRGKYRTVPIPGSEVTLNQDDLISAAKEEKTTLMERLKNYLDQTSRTTQLEKRKDEANFLQDQLNKIPLQIFIG